MHRRIGWFILFALVLGSLATSASAQAACDPSAREQVYWHPVEVMRDWIRSHIQSAYYSWHTE